jgi:predicted thioesterase
MMVGRFVADMSQVCATPMMILPKPVTATRRIGDGSHRRGVVDVEEFEKRFEVKRLSMSLD